MRTWLIQICLAVSVLSASSFAGEITVAAAADLQYALKEVAARFEKESGNTVKLTFGSSGNFYSQIANGAPFDVFLSADSEYPKKLIEAGAADRNSLFVYGVGRIVLWVPGASKLDLNKGLKVLLDPAVRKVALANPQHAPYGRAAVAALRHEGLYDQVSGKFVFGENISQTMHFIESGNVDAGFVALSLATAPPTQGRGRYWVVPQDFYPTIEQAAVVISHSPKKKTASAFLDFLRKPEIVELMGRYGFERPGSKR
ncbi:MAG: molybdate ABC transporter substrate-binding protein [Acidobacteriia bacterium]|nr:molybdate ABC transporter substrate-binding protein [Terriglobia bacterium]